MRVEAESLKQKSEISVIAPNVPPTETPAKTYTQTDSETPTRKELGKLFNVSHEAIRIWEENGKLKELGWERIPSAGNPVRYRQLLT